MTKPGNKKYIVPAEYFLGYKKILNIWAENEEQARQKAEQLILGWKNVVEVDVKDDEIEIAENW